ncbi:hypothetical protein D3C71_964150 [compost metagenome]
MEKTNVVVKFTVEQYQDAKVKAKELGINSVGKSKQVLVDLVNTALETQNEVNGTPAGNENGQAETPKVKKWFEEVQLDVKDGDIVQIVSKTIVKAGVSKEILQDRYAKVLKASPRKGLIRAMLLDPRTGEVLKCTITLEIGKYNKVPEGWTFTPPTNEVVETPATAEPSSNEQPEVA